MSNHTPVRTLRVDDELWARAQAAAAVSGASLSDVLRSALLDYCETVETRERRAERSRQRRAARAAKARA